MSIEFREATREDVPEVVALLADDVLGKTREHADTAAYLAAFEAMQDEINNLLIVGVDETGVVVATYQLTLISGLSLGATRRAQVEAVRIASHLRGHGLGHDMLKDAESRACAAGCGLIQLTMNKNRRDSHRFYESLGFTASHIGFKRVLD